MPFTKRAGALVASALLVSVPFISSTIASDTSDNDAGQRYSLKRDATNNHLRMLSSNSGSIALQRAAGESVADAVKRQFSSQFGIRNPANDLVVKGESHPSVNRHNIRYQQLYRGIPVFGGELIANLDSQALSSISGKTSQVNLTDVSPEITPTQASDLAKQAVAKWQQRDSYSLTTSEPELVIYDPSLIGPGDGPQALVWKLSVTSGQLPPVNELVLINANNGAIALHFDQVDHVLDRETYSANNTTTIPGTLLCDDSVPPPATCTTDVDVEAAHLHAGDFYNFFFSNHNRDSIDDAGTTIVSITHYDAPGAGIALWDGTQILLSDGMPAADDVVAHELTHGIIEQTANLNSYFQSGAISESLADMWGEFIDQSNTSGTDDAGVRWLIGEDIPGIAGAARSMQDPPAYGDPDRMTHANYDQDDDMSDDGGIHTNGGVNNKAVYLMVEGSAAEPGGQFNGRTITGIGMTKVASIYYDVLTNYLGIASDYLDLYNALNQSCISLIGTNGITYDDCTQVANATEAVEMHLQPVADFNPGADVCPAGSVLGTTLFSDDFESGLTSWTVNITSGTPWITGLNYTTSGSQFAFAPGSNTTAIDSALELTAPVAIPATGSHYLHFNHFFEFEFFNTDRIDGGVIEYSTDNGATWNDAGSLIDSGRAYNGTLNDLFMANPLYGRQAFTTVSHGYNSTRLDLSGFAGQNLQIRFRNAADDFVASGGWGIDDVRIYSCVTNAVPTSNAGLDQEANANTNVGLDGSGSMDADGDPISYLWLQTTGPTVTLSGSTTATPSFTAPATATTLAFELRVTDSHGQTSTDAVTITINGPPAASAGLDQTVNTSASVTLDGSGSSDPESGAISYSWTQTGGTMVALTGADTAMPTFTAPSTASTLTFQLAVTDNRGQTTTDDVTVNVQAAAPAGGGGGGGGGGGCSVSDNGRFDPIWLLLLMILACLHYRNRQRLH